MPVCSEKRGLLGCHTESRQGEEKIVKAALGGDMQRAGRQGDWNADRSLSWMEGLTAQEQVKSM